jgi:hypothetical protein
LGLSTGTVSRPLSLKSMYSLTTDDVPSSIRALSEGRWPVTSKSVVAPTVAVTSKAPSRATIATVALPAAPEQRNE